jgi:hypothetical protein
MPVSCDSKRVLKAEKNPPEKTRKKPAAGVSHGAVRQALKAKTAFRKNPLFRKEPALRYPSDIFDIFPSFNNITLLLAKIECLRNNKISNV